MTRWFDYSDDAGHESFQIAWLALVTGGHVACAGSAARLAALAGLLGRMAAVSEPNAGGGRSPCTPGRLAMMPDEQTLVADAAAATLWDGRARDAVAGMLLRIGARITSS